MSNQGLQSKISSRVWMILAIGGLAGLLGGCTIHTHYQAPPSTATVTPTTVATPHPTQCAIDEKAYTDRGVQFENNDITVNIVRTYQEVVHQDCHGATIKSGIETVGAPTAPIEFTPPAPIGRAGAVRLFNSTSCDWSTAQLDEDRHSIARAVGRVTGDPSGHLNIVVDASLGVFTFHVKPGMNMVFYQYFADCVPDDLRRKVSSQPSCPSSQEVSEGMVRINVNYSEATLPGQKVQQDGECGDSK